MSEIPRAVIPDVPCAECDQLVCEPETCPLELLNRLKALIADLKRRHVAIPTPLVPEWQRLSAILEEW